MFWNKKKQSAADEAAIAEVRSALGDAAAGQFERDLYLRRARPIGGFAGMVPKSVMIIAALWLAAVETAAKLPDMATSYDRFQAMHAEYGAKPALVAAQLGKAQLEFKAAGYQPVAAAAGAMKAEAEAVAAMQTMDPKSASRLNVLLALLDPSHSFLVSVGIIDPMKDITSALRQIQDHKE